MPRYSFRVLVVASLTAALVSSMGPGLPQKVAGHTTDKYGWGDCNWGWKDDDVTPNILVRTDPNYPFPADVWVDGVLNSFERGTTEALAEWNTVLYRTSLGLRTRFERVSSTSFAHIVLQFNSTLLPSGAYGGTFLTNHDPGDCVVHSPVTDILT